MDKDNLSIWSQCDKTPSEYTKQFTKAGGFRGTDISPQYRVKKLTEIFGPVGKGWGYEILSRWRETFGGADFVFVELRLWYQIDNAEEQFFTGPQIGGTAAERTPDEAYKMAVTDALGKCASQLGVGADVYLGESDSKYLSPQKKSFPNEKSEAPLHVGTASALLTPAQLEDKVITIGEWKGKRFFEIATPLLEGKIKYFKAMAKPGFGVKDFFESAEIIVASRKAINEKKYTDTEDNYFESEKPLAK